MVGLKARHSAFFPSGQEPQSKREGEFHRFRLAEQVDFARLKKEKYQHADLKQQYLKKLEQSMVVSIAFLLILFQVTRLVKTQPAELAGTDVIIEVADIPPTEQPSNLPPPPGRPAVPVPTENELVPEDVTIQTTDLNLDLAELPPPPSANEGIDESYVFIPYDEPPVPIGGLQSINEYLKYPEIARRAGIEGVVILGVLVDENGNSLKTQVLKPSGTSLGFEQAAEEAAMKLKWKPAKQRDRAIKVWVSFPIRFQLSKAQMAS